MKTGLESLDIGASNITYSGNEGPKSPQQIAEADYMLLEEYQKYVFEMEEMGLEPMSFEQFRQEAMSGMAMGGRVGYASGQLVKPGPGRPGYRGDDAYGNRSSARERGATASRSRQRSAPRSSVGGDDRREQVSVSRTQGRAAPTTSQIRSAVTRKRAAGNVGGKPKNVKTFTRKKKK